jgi:hypothetical protein
MSVTRGWAAAGLGTAVFLLAAVATVRAQDAGAGGSTKQPYTAVEYNAYTACAQEKVAATKVKCLESFVVTFPNPALLIYAYPEAYKTYAELRNYAKVIEFVDKYLALGDKVDAAGRYQALYARAFAFNNLNSSDPAQVAKARQAALDGVKALNELKKADTLDEKTFADQKKPLLIYLNMTGGTTAMTLQDFPAAEESFKAVLALSPDDPIANYQLGRAYLAAKPPQQMEGFWSIARAVASKSATPQQVKSVTVYLRKLLLNYQQPGCDNLIDSQMNEMIQLASGSADLPASYKFPSTADLDAARKDMTILSVITDLKAGGDKAKITWLASCGLEFPNVPGKLMAVAPGTDSVELKVAFATNDAEFEAAKTPDMDVKVVDQPEAARLVKDNLVQFTATLATYDPDPFLLHWEKGKVNPDNIPPEKKPVRRPPPRHTPPKNNPNQ